MKTYKGRYKPSNASKYVGDIDNVVYRSGWERHVMKWCDTNPDVVQWMSEELVIPYICETDKKPHRYFMDFVIKFRSGRVVLVEVKPEKETKRPQRTQGKSRQTLLNEGMTYIKNQSKWKAASEYTLTVDTTLRYGQRKNSPPWVSCPSLRNVCVQRNR